MKDPIALIDAYLDGTLSAAEREALVATLKADTAQMRLFVETVMFEEQIRAGVLAGNLQKAADVFARQSVASVTPAPRRWFQPEWISVAAGLVLGLFSASMVFGGYVGGMGTKPVLLLQEGFESGPAPEVKGIPAVPGIWSGDFTEVVGQTQGISPVQGGRMLRFLRADFEGKTSQTGYLSDLFRIIDVQNHMVSFADGRALVTFEASFRTIPTSTPLNYRCGLRLDALASLPTQDKSPYDRPTERDGSTSGQIHPSLSSEERPEDFSPASTHRFRILEDTGASWQKVQVELRIPPGTRYLLLCVQMSDSKAGRTMPDPAAVSFPGQFVDDITVSLTRSAPARE
jgi:hypothetical protein